MQTQFQRMLKTNDSKRSSYQKNGQASTITEKHYQPETPLFTRGSNTGHEIDMTVSTPHRQKNMTEVGKLPGDTGYLPNNVHPNSKTSKVEKRHTSNLTPKQQLQQDMPLDWREISQINRDSDENFD